MKQHSGGNPGSTSLRSPEPVPVSAHTGDDPGRKWTPAPWELRSREAFGEREIAIEPTEPQANKGRVIALCYGLDRSANARLIAAAPELYALLAILEWGDDERPGCPFCGMGKESGHLDRCQLNDALAKAKGGE